MEFRSASPHPALTNIIECFWTVDGEQRGRQKVIPDAFVELIFHFGDPYRIRLNTRWELQKRSLLAGQISKHFSLEGTGRSEIFAIKFTPTAVKHLFGIDMDRITNKVIDPASVDTTNELASLDKLLRDANRDDRQALCEDFFAQKLDRVPSYHPADAAVDMIFAEHGIVNIGAIAANLHVGERHLEQVFKKFVGLSPKFFSRVVRFNYIFKLIQDNNPDWSDVVFRSGYYDQSHFIRNFKAFTGEDPSKYMFDRKDMANFFLRQR